MFGLNPFMAGNGSAERKFPADIITELTGYSGVYRKINIY